MLRSLNLTANQLGDEGLAAFFDALPRTGTSLHTLCLSVNTFDQSGAQPKSAAAIARFLRDPNACRGLERLHLNGNYFGWEGVCTIAHAVMGSRRACTLGGTIEATTPPADATPPNTSLLYLDLFSTGIDSLEAAAPPIDTQPWEAGSPVTPDNWYALLTQQLECNGDRRARCRRAALQLLPIARIVGCRAHHAEHGGGFPLLCLPLELRGLVLWHLDEDNALTHEQFTRVLQWACEPSTLGYGLCAEPLGPPAPPLAEATLPVEPWSWEACFALRSHERNWYSEYVEAAQHIPLGHPTVPLPHPTPDMLAFWECTGTDHAEAT